jgi:hypothetical protein
MNKTRTPFSLIATAAIAATAMLALAGCSAVDEVAHKVRSQSFDTSAALASGWKGSAPWLPTDSTSIQLRQSTVADDAVLLVKSDQELKPELCAQVTRQSAPSYEIDGAPDVYAAKKVYACGGWSVIKAGDGWLGWTPNHPDERAKSPSR